MGMTWFGPRSPVDATRAGPRSVPSVNRPAPAGPPTEGEDTDPVHTTTTTRAGLWAAALAGIVLLAACGAADTSAGTGTDAAAPAPAGSTDRTDATDDPADDASDIPVSDGHSGVTVDDLVGRDFRVIDTVGIDLADGSDVTISFTDEPGVAIIGGCNTQFGPIDLTDGTLRAGPLLGTMMACEEPLMEQDRALSALFEGGVVPEFTGDILTLTAGAITLTLRETAAAGAPAGPVTGIDGDAPQPDAHRAS